MNQDLFDVANRSPVHQLLLYNGQIDRVPLAQIEKLKNQFTGDHKLWLESDILDFLTSNFDKDVVDSFNTIKPLAFKADLARYCILYVYGGWYFDLFVDVVNPRAISNFNTEINFIFFREVPVPPFGSIFAAVNTLFWVKDPGNPIIENVIQSCVRNITNKKYNNHPFDVTGPMVFGREIANYQLKVDDYRFLIGDCQIVDSQPTHVFNSVELDNPLVFSKRRSVSEDISNVVPTGYERHPNNYYQMWHDRDIFN